MQNLFLKSVLSLLMLSIAWPCLSQTKSVGYDNGLLKKNIPYYSDYEKYPNNTLDIYIPNMNTKVLLPMIMVAGDNVNNSITPLQALLDNNFAIVDVKYRDTLQAKFPAPIVDICNAYYWLKNNAHKYGMHPDKIVFWGVGYGGYLLDLAATAGSYTQGFFSEVEFGSSSEMYNAEQSVQLNQKWVTAFNAQEKIDPACVISFYAPIPLKGQESPITYITPCTPPFMIIDNIHNSTTLSKSVKFNNSLKSVICPESVAKCPVQLLLVPNVQGVTKQNLVPDIINFISLYVR